MTEVAERAAADGGTPVNGPGPRLRDLPVRWWRQLTSMRVALILLFLLAAAAVPGSVLPQRGIDPGAVGAYFTERPELARWLDRLGLFDVYGAPWFAAIYLALFVSLIGCVVPRLGQHLRALRTPPPPTPRHLHRLAEHTSYETALAPDAERERIAHALRRRRWRVVVRDGAVCAEKGFLREWGNLAFHYALVLLLVAVAAGGLFGYRGSVVLVEGDTFANTPLQYSALDRGRVVDDTTLQPFTVRLDDFRAVFLPDGQPIDFTADVTWRESPSAPERRAGIEPNHPLGVPGSWLTGPTNVYLIGHGYQVHLEVRDPSGDVIAEGGSTFRPVPGDGMLTSTGVFKVPAATPEQLGFDAVLTPTTVTTPQGPVSVHPEAIDPRLTLVAYRGDLGFGSGTQSVFELDLDGLSPVTGDDGRPLRGVIGLGETWELPDGHSVTFTELTQWTQLSVGRDPGKRAALLAAVLMITGLLLSLFVRRRRIWLRVGDGSSPGSSLVEVGGLSRREGDSFDEEFDRLVRRLRGIEEDAP